MTGDVQRTLKGKRFTMKPRPDQEKIEKGMSSKFLKVCFEELIRRALRMSFDVKCCKRTETLRLYKKYNTEIKIGIVFVVTIFVMYLVMKCYDVDIERRKKKNLYRGCYLYIYRCIDIGFVIFVY